MFLFGIKAPEVGWKHHLPYLSCRMSGMQCRENIYIGFQKEEKEDWKSASSDWFFFSIFVISITVLLFLH